MWPGPAQLRNGADQAVIKSFPSEPRAAAERFEIPGDRMPLLAESCIDRVLLVPDPSDGLFRDDGPSLRVHTKRTLPDLPEGT